ncbi:zinc-dependent metalloprotease family protein [Chamaesiphon sp. VAR_48_metabat_135_sub]|uniref:zinc-dependent metalloprotease family protein n=1 Tax=Chamaesiphon sp. VAR_48_metabat_135_sub TaxID=2964699 RepID=UPI00286A156F|nr:zinc-dependent metalloprotease family protein [Chamaesiphon sp. VAR_48_metabat_135_sub]
MYDRLNFKKNSNRDRLPIWERIDLKRPLKARCSSCRLPIQPNWRICPQCGANLNNRQPKYPHCIWVNACWVDVDPQTESMLLEILEDVFAKVFSAFRSINVFLTSEPPDPQQWGERFTHIGLIVDREPVDYLGIASFRQGGVTDRAIVRLDQILNTSERAHLSSGQLSNLMANTIAHEVAHTLGLDHSELPADVMNDGLDHRIHSLMPPSFHAEQITQMNYAIHQHQATLLSSLPAAKIPKQK